jgi:hypothetical protein
MGIDFIGGLLTGASCACLIVGIFQWFSSRGSRLGPDPSRTNGVVTKIEKRILNRTGLTCVDNGVETKIEQRFLNGMGLICAVSQGVTTLLFALILSQDVMHRNLLALVIAWFAASLILGVMFAIAGYRSETVTYRHSELE